MTEIEYGTITKITEKFYHVDVLYYGYFKYTCIVPKDKCFHPNTKCLVIRDLCFGDLFERAYITTNKTYSKHFKEIKDISKRYGDGWITCGKNIHGQYTYYFEQPITF